ncbi:hypothetical protein THOE12_10311 [Vibrio rotiferianus]|nr:hypothetical protein THOE12_10311 [Vibrio rotiferianus]
MVFENQSVSGGYEDENSFAGWLLILIFILKTECSLFLAK